MFQVIDAQRVRTVSAGSRFVLRNPVNLTLLRAALVDVATIDTEPVTQEYVNRLVFPSMMQLRAATAVLDDGRQTYDLFNADGRALLKSNGTPVFATLATVEVSTLTLASGVAPHEGWFASSDGTHRVATLVTTDTVWSDVLAQGSLPSITRRCARMPILALSALAARLVAESYTVTHRGFHTDGSGRPVFRIGASASDEFVSSEPYFTLNATTYPTPRTAAEPLVIEAANPVSNRTVSVGTVFKVWIPG